MSDPRIEKLAKEIKEACREECSDLGLHECDLVPLADDVVAILTRHLAVAAKAQAERDKRIEQLEIAFRHYHVSQEGLDACAHCGLDLRDPVHVRLLAPEEKEESDGTILHRPA